MYVYIYVCVCVENTTYMYVCVENTTYICCIGSCVVWSETGWCHSSRCVRDRAGHVRFVKCNFRLSWGVDDTLSA